MTDGWISAGLALAAVALAVLVTLVLHLLFPA